MLANNQYSEQPYSGYSDNQFSGPPYSENNYETPYSGYSDTSYDVKLSDTPYLESGGSVRQQVNDNSDRAIANYDRSFGTSDRSVDNSDRLVDNSDRVRDSRLTTSRRRTSSYRDTDRPTGGTATVVRTAEDRSDRTPVRRRVSASRRVRQRARVVPNTDVPNDVRSNEIRDQPSARF